MPHSSSHSRWLQPPPGKGKKGANTSDSAFMPGSKMHPLSVEDDDCAVSRTSTERVFFYPPLSPSTPHPVDALIAAQDQEPESDTITPSFALTSPLSGMSSSAASDTPMVGRLIPHPYQMAGYYARRTESDDSLKREKPVSRPPVQTQQIVSPPIIVNSERPFSSNRAHLGSDFMHGLVPDPGPAPQPAWPSVPIEAKNRSMEVASSRSSRLVPLRDYLISRPLILILLFLPIPPLLAILYLVIGHSILQTSSFLDSHPPTPLTARPSLLMATHTGATGGAILSLPLACAFYVIHQLCFSKSRSRSSSDELDIPVERPFAETPPRAPNTLQIPPSSTHLHPNDSNTSTGSSQPVSRFSILSTLTEKERYQNPGKSRPKPSPTQRHEQEQNLKRTIQERQQRQRHADDFFEDDSAASDTHERQHSRSSPVVIGRVVCFLLAFGVGPLAGVLGVKCLGSSASANKSGELLTVEQAAGVGAVGAGVLVGGSVLMWGAIALFTRSRSASQKDAI